MKLFGYKFSLPLHGLRVHAARLSVGTMFAVLFASGVVACGNSVSATTDQTPPTSSSSGAGSAAQMVPDSLKNKTLNVAVLNNYPPGGFMEGAKLTGFGPDLAQAIAADAGLNLNLEVASFDVVIPGLQSKRWDFAIPPFSVTDARLKVLDLIPFMSTGTVFIVGSNSGVSVNSASDLCGRTLGGLQGSNELTAAADLSNQCQQSGKPAITVQAFGSQNEAVLALSSSRVEAVATGAATAGYLVQQNNGKFSLGSFTYQSYFNGIGFAKGNDQLEPVVVQALKDLEANGTYKKILEKYNLSNLAVSDFGVRK